MGLMAFHHDDASHRDHSGNGRGYGDDDADDADDDDDDDEGRGGGDLVAGGIDG